MQIPNKKYSVGYEFKHIKIIVRHCNYKNYNCRN